MLLATIRRDHEVPGDLTAHWKDELVARLEITGLACSDSEQLVEMVLGSPVHGATMERLWNLTEGNVLFLRVAIDTALTSGELTERDGIWRLDGHFEPGQALVDLVRLRLGSLTARQERVLEYVALAEPVDADIITAIMPPADLQDAERTGALTVAVAREIRAGSVGDDAVDPRHAEPPVRRPSASYTSRVTMSKPSSSRSMSLRTTRWSSPSTPPRRRTQSPRVRPARLGPPPLTRRLS